MRQNASLSYPTTFPLWFPHFSGQVQNVIWHQFCKHRFNVSNNMNECSLYCNSWIPCMPFSHTPLSVLSIYQPKATISKRTRSTANACDYCSSNSIKPSSHLTAPSFIMHVNAWRLQRRSLYPGIPLTALIKAVAAHEKKKNISEMI